MTFSKGGTIFLNGKTYNVSQINSVYIETIKKYSTFGVIAIWFVIGIFCTYAINNTILWNILTFASILVAIYMISIRVSAVFFDLSSGKVDVYTSDDYEEVKKIASDIIRGMEEGYFPNYLRQG